MDLEKNYKIGGLFYFYKNLLTQKQQAIFEDYYFNDNSLSEISLKFNISRQAVLDCLNRAEKVLTHYESVLKLSEIYYSQQKIIENLKKENKNIIEELNKILKLWGN